MCNGKELLLVNFEAINICHLDNLFLTFEIPVIWNPVPVIVIVVRTLNPKFCSDKPLSRLGIFDGGMVSKHFVDISTYL
jgi:hypothetical protein